MRHRLKDLHAGDSLRLEFQRGAFLGEGSSGDEASVAGGGRCKDGVQEAFESVRSVTAGAVVLALGGASWPQTGSDGGWVGLLQRKGVLVSALRPANCGWERDWPPEVLAACEGKPLKNIMATAGGVTVRGELLVTRYGLEGGALYSLSQALHEMASPLVSIDFKPDSSLESLVRRLGTARSNFLSEARLRWRLDEPTHALLSALLPVESFRSAETTAQSTKRFELTLSHARPVAEAISTAGGVAFSGLTETLMLQQLPGVFVAGEMVDWEAPTGGYLMQGCFATGTRSGLGAAEWRMVPSP